MEQRATTKPKTITLQTIADRLGVSRTTVSNAYGRPDQLNPALRTKILAVAKELGYAGPDPAARTLRRGQAGVLGVLFGENLAYAFRDPGAVLMFQGVAEAAEEAGVNLLLVAAPPDRPVDPTPIREAVVDRFVTLCIAEDEEKLKVPFVSTASWGYLRLRRPDYSDKDLRGWVQRVKDEAWKEAFVFFKHEDEGKAPEMAKRFVELSA